MKNELRELKEKLELKQIIQKELKNNLLKIKEQTRNDTELQRLIRKERQIISLINDKLETLMNTIIQNDS